MALATGTRLGPYEIVAPLGAGGMGEVYRARDTRLGRDVAVKILPQHLAESPGFRERFEREARSISQLSHPHICPLYDIGHESGVSFLVLECLEGETLEQRLTRGPLPPEQAIRTAIQIADALDKAHQRGIVHRDLKPANVMLTKAGAKLMDFGLARQAAEAPVAAALTEMTAETKKLTAEGSIIGTFQYMSPEQLEGQEADARTDIFALGAVMYEMATGKPAFHGRTKASLIASILSSEPQPIAAVQPMSPPALDRVVRTCLAKDPAERFQSAHDLKLQLEWISEAGSQAGVPAPVAQRRKRREWMAWGTALVLLVVAAAGFYLAYREHSRIFPIAVRSSLEAPDKQEFAFTGDGGGPPTISPDGTSVVFAALDSDGNQHLWLRRLNSLATQMIPGTDNGNFPFWSYDGRKIGFFADGSLKVADLLGTPPLAICPASNGRGGTWNQNDEILFSPEFRSGLFLISGSGGTPKPVLDLGAGSFSSYRWPEFLPDGKHFLFLGIHHEGGPQSTLFLGSLGGGKPVEIMKTTAAARYASGRLLFLRDTTLVAQPMDPSSGKLSGEPVPVADQVLWDGGVWRGVFDASANGVLVYEQGSSVAATRMAWFDRSGKQTDTVDIPTGYSTMGLSRDGKFLAVQGNPSSDLWIYDLVRGAHTRLTFDPAQHSNPVWSPDGRWVAYNSSATHSEDILRKRTDGVGVPELLYTSVPTKLLSDWSFDGKYLLYFQGNDNNRGNGIWALPLEGEHKPFLLLQSAFNNSSAVFSPDGRWVAYASDESGRNEVYVTNFPKPAGKWQVSTQGGLTASWSHDGKQIFFVSTTDNRLMAAEVSATGDQFAVGSVKPLFRLSGTARLFPWFGASPAGDKFLAPSPTGENQPPITLITNWTADLKK
jgi:serine/threonine protein kinase